jgi:hypothetical protein
MKNGCGDEESHLQFWVRGTVSFSAAVNEVIRPSFRVTQVLAERQDPCVNKGLIDFSLYCKNFKHPSRSLPFVGSA